MSLSTDTYGYNQYHYRFILPILELYINHTVAFFYVWFLSLSILVMSLICVVAYISILFLLLSCVSLYD